VRQAAIRHDLLFRTVRDEVMSATKKHQVGGGDGVAERALFARA
jgi:hypothetical protein